MRRALAGVRVLVTRPERQAESMAAALRVAGAEPVMFPTTRIVGARDGGVALASAAASIGSFDWVVLSSANGVDRLAAALKGAGTLERAARARFAVVGPATAAALRRHGLEAAVVARRQVAEGLVDALAAVELSGSRVLLALAAGARPILRDALATRGADVVTVEAYRSIADGRGAGEVRGRLDRGEIEVVTFTSPSTVQQFAELVGADVGGALVAVIGPVTAEAAVAAGMTPQVIASQHTVPGLIDALVEHYSSTTKS